MEITKPPSRAVKRLRFRSRRSAGEKLQPAALAGAATEEPRAERHSPFSPLAEALTAIYVGAARIVLHGIEAFQDDRAERRVAALRDGATSAPPVHRAARRRQAAQEFESRKR